SRVYAELVSVLLTRDSLVDEGLAHLGTGDTEPGHPVDGIYGQTEAVSVVANGKLQRGVDVTLLLVTAHVDIVLAGPAVSETVDQPRVTVKVKHHRLVRCKNGLEL